MRLFIFCLFALFSTGAHGDECYRTSIAAPSPFMGNHGEFFQTTDGETYAVVGSYEYLYSYNPSITICPSRGKVLVEGKTLGIRSIKTSQRPSSSNSKKGKTADQQTGRSSTALITVTLRVRSCAYFLADGPLGLYLLEWYGGHDPDLDEGIFGDLGSYGFKDVFYEKGVQGRLYVDDYMLSKSSALEKLNGKCK